MFINSSIIVVFSCALVTFHFHASPLRAIGSDKKRIKWARISPSAGAPWPPPPNSSERIYLSRFRRATRVSAQRDRARPWPQLVWVIQSRFGPLNSHSVPTLWWWGGGCWLVRAVIVVSDLQLENAMNPQVRVCSPVPTRRRPSGSTGLIYYTRRSRLAQLVPGLSLSPVLRELLIRQVPASCSVFTTCAYQCQGKYAAVIIESF